MNLETIIASVTMIVSLVCGMIAKKVKWFNNKLIPIQNLLIGLISALIYYLYTRDFNLVIASTGLFAGGAYDIVHNLKLVIEGK